MGNLIVIAAVLFLLWRFSGSLKKYDSQPLARLGKAIAGGLLVSAGAVLIAKEQLLPALLAFGVGSSLLGWDVWALFKGRGSARVSRFNASTVYLELDNLTGQMDGLVQRGPFAGRRLSRMAQAEIVAVMQGALEIGDRAGAELLQAYLHRRFAGGREDAQRDMNARARDSRNPGAVTEQEAYDILGLKPGASTEDIKGAYRTLMKKLHPDLGGTAYLAARVNEAKEVLLSRHR